MGQLKKIDPSEQLINIARPSLSILSPPLISSFSNPRISRTRSFCNPQELINSWGIWGCGHSVASDLAFRFHASLICLCLLEFKLCAVFLLAWFFFSLVCLRLKIGVWRSVFEDRDYWRVSDLRSSYDFFEPRISVSDTPIFGGGEVQGVGAQVSKSPLAFAFVLFLWCYFVFLISVASLPDKVYLWLKIKI